MTIEVVINRQPVELHKLLKFEGLVASGGDAKTVISEGLVQVNGQVETQKRKKIVDGDVVEFNGDRMVIRFDLSRRSDETQPSIPGSPTTQAPPIRRKKPALNRPK